jgi:chemotaxis protein CheX
MDVRIINPFIQSVTKTFSTMLGATATRGKVGVSRSPAGGGDIIAFIGIVGSTRGTIAVAMPTRTALRVVERMLGVQTKILDDTVADAVGELVNIIAGSAKAELSNDLSEPLELSLPTVVRGHEFQIKYPDDTTWLEVPFDSDVGPLVLKVVLQPAAVADRGVRS